MKLIIQKHRLIFTIILVTAFILQMNASSFSPADSVMTKGKKKAKNIILLIGDGMGVAQIYSGIVVNGQLNVEQFQNIGFHKTYSADNFVTDSGAGATAISTGKKTKNGSIAVDTSGNTLKTILEISEDLGMNTGLVSTSSITHATPASFIAHNKNRSDYQKIAEDFLKTDIEVFIGGGKNDFNKRKDGQDLTIKLKERGYVVTDTISEVIKINKGKLAGFTSKGHNPSILEGRGDMLCIATETAINILKECEKGFFLMIEGSQIDWGDHENNSRKVEDEMIDFDKAIGKALDFAKKDGNTLVIVTGDHETGGMAITSGNIKTKTIEAAFTTKDHTGVMIPVFAFGPGSENFRGIYENTDLFYKMLECLKLNKNQVKI